LSTDLRRRTERVGERQLGLEDDRQTSLCVDNLINRAQRGSGCNLATGCRLLTCVEITTMNP